MFDNLVHRFGLMLKTSMNYSFNPSHCLSYSQGRIDLYLIFPDLVKFHIEVDGHGFVAQLLKDLVDGIANTTDAGRMIDVYKCSPVLTQPGNHVLGVVGKLIEKYTDLFFALDAQISKEVPKIFA
ncbi:hypothetical protein ACOME3_000388 [Neoechinorhynchus agilis]